MSRLLLLLLLFVSAVPASDAENVVYQIKASYIFNFLQFVQFQEQSLSHPGKVGVCIQGENRFGNAINKLMGAKVPQGNIHVAVLARDANALALSACQVVYLVGSDRDLAVQTLAMIDQKNTLTIGEFPDFIAVGGYIELFIRDDNVRFRFNKSLAGHTDFNVASQLLSLGDSGT